MTQAARQQLGIALPLGVALGRFRGAVPAGLDGPCRCAPLWSAGEVARWIISPRRTTLGLCGKLLAHLGLMHARARDAAKHRIELARQQWLGRRVDFIRYRPVHVQETPTRGRIDSALSVACESPPAPADDRETIAQVVISRASLGNADPPGSPRILAAGGKSDSHAPLN